MALSRLVIYQDIVNPTNLQVYAIDSNGKVYVKNLSQAEYSQLKNLGVKEERVNNTNFQGEQLQSLNQLKDLATAEIGMGWDWNTIQKSGGSSTAELIKNRDMLASADFTKLPTTGATFITPEQATEYQKTSYGGAEGLNATLSSQGLPSLAQANQPNIQTLGSLAGSTSDSVQSQIDDIASKITSMQSALAEAKKQGITGNEEIPQEILDKYNITPTTSTAGIPATEQELAQYREGDVRLSPTTGQKEMLNPEGNWVPLTAGMQPTGMEKVAGWQQAIAPEAINTETGLIKTTEGEKPLAEITTPDGEMKPEYVDKIENPPGWTPPPIEYNNQVSPTSPINPITGEPNIQPTETTPTTPNNQDAIKAQMAEIQKKIDLLQLVLEAATKAGYGPGTGKEIPQEIINQVTVNVGDENLKAFLTDLTNKVTDPAQLEALQAITDKLGSPSEDERAAARQEAEQYYGYTLPTESAPYQYPQQEAEITQEYNTAEQRAIQDYEYQMANIGQEKTNLAQEYQNYLEDINTGKLRVGSEYQKAEEYRLEQKRQYLEQYEFNLTNGMEQLNRQWIGRGGLFSGVRAENVGKYQTQQEMGKQQYLTSWQYNQGTAKTAYEQAIEDYATKQQRLGQTYQQQLGSIGLQEQRYGALKQRSIEDIALQKIRDIRSLQEKYQAAIGTRMAQTLMGKYV